MNAHFPPRLVLAAPLALAAFMLAAGAPMAAGEPSFIRGDVTPTGESIELSDAVAILGYLFTGGAELPCLAAADVDDNNELDLADPVYLLRFSFLGGPEPRGPYPACGRDPSPSRISCRLPPERCSYYLDAVFRSTHNSYSGPSGLSVREQLDAGVRFLELDVHDNGYTSEGDYRIGHDSPGNAVQRRGNLDTDRLRPWLDLVASWSRERGGNHAPLTIALDLKDNLTDNHFYWEGNLAALNDEITTAFGGMLFTADAAAGGWPTLEALRGRALVVLSGDRRTRDLYLRDPGRNPAVAMNAFGQVVEVHDSGDGTLWYWTGLMDAGGRVTWFRHGRYDTGVRPAVAINNEGWIVEVHESENQDTLWYHAGRLGGDYDISFSDSRKYNTGVNPTVRFLSLEGFEVSERHKSESTGKGWAWDGTFQTAGLSVSWRNNRRTDSPLYDKARSDTGASFVAVHLAGDGDTLRYASQGVGEGPIRYIQTAFVECQKGDESSLPCSSLDFHAASAGGSDDRAWGAARRLEGKAVRLWEFNSPGDATSPPVSFPATDEPAAQWYRNYLTSIGARE